MKQFNVMIWDINNNKLVSYDILPYFRKEYQECKKQDRPKTRKEWKEFVERWGHYRFWSRCEYEIIVSPWPTQDKDVKIDVWYQIQNNLDLVVDLLIEEIKCLKIL